MTTSTSKIIPSAPATLAHASKLWDIANDAGEGFAPDFAETLEAELADQLEGTDSVVLVEDRTRVLGAVSVRTLAVAWLHGLWAVDVTGQL